MPVHDAIPQTFTQRERLHQIKELFEQNEVPKPYIMWFDGRGLIDFLKSIGKTPVPKDGAIFHNQLYRYNLEINRFRKAEPWKPTK